MINSNHHSNFTLPRYQSIIWKQSIKSVVVRVLRLSKQDSRCSGSTIVSIRGAVTSNHQWGAGLYTPPGSTCTPYLSHNRSAVMHRAICTGSLSKLNGPNAMLLGTGGITVGKVNSRPFSSLVHSLNRGQGAFSTPGNDSFSRITSTGWFPDRSTAE